jgi:isocitrate/isopropylmalate dehydrogenase
MTTDPTAQAASVRIAVMEGDGIGPEIMAATMAVLRTVDRAFKLGLSFAGVDRHGCAARAGHHVPAGGARGRQSSGRRDPRPRFAQ